MQRPGECAHSHTRTHIHSHALTHTQSRAHTQTYTKHRIVPSHIKGRGYGFVSFLDPMDCARAMREQQGKYLGGRPIAISRADWKKRDLGETKKKEKKKAKMAQSLGL